MGTALVFLLVLALCGFIAYIGDLLGRRLGKKRLTVFGLRPKHTAILLTIVTGIVIASTTLGLALLIVPGFSKVVTQGERMLAINSRLTGENSLLQKQNERLRKDTAQEKRRNDQLSGQNAELAKKNGELQRANDTIAAQNAALTTTNRSLAAGNKALKDQNLALSTGNKSLADANKTLSSQQVFLSKRVFSLRQETTQYQEGHYLFRAKEDIVRRAIPPNPPSDVVREQLKNLEFEVRSHAAALISQQKGVEIDPKQIQTVLVPAPGVRAPKDRDALENWLTDQTVNTRNTQILLRAIAAQNCIEGKPIQYYVDPFANRLVFNQGQEIASTYIAGRLKRHQILQQLLYFLQDDVRKKAIGPPNNMLPGSEGIGQLFWEPIVDTMDEISLRPGGVTVVAVASTNVHRASPLNVQFQVKPGDF